jgi:hypothetical protein
MTRIQHKKAAKVLLEIYRRQCFKMRTENKWNKKNMITIRSVQRSSKKVKIPYFMFLLICNHSFLNHSTRWRMLHLSLARNKFSQRFKWRSVSPDITERCSCGSHSAVRGVLNRHVMTLVLLLVQ